MTHKTLFPGFCDDLDVSGWPDSSWHNDESPSFQLGMGFTLYVNHPDDDSAPRFAVLDDDGNAVLETDNFSDVERFAQHPDREAHSALLIRERDEWHALRLWDSVDSLSRKRALQYARIAVPRAKMRAVLSGDELP